MIENSDYEEKIEFKRIPVNNGILLEKGNGSENDNNQTPIKEKRQEREYNLIEELPQCSSLSHGGKDVEGKVLEPDEPKSSLLKYSQLKFHH